MVDQFKNQSGGVVQFSNHVSADFQEYRQLNNKDNEAGGVLIGRILLNNNDIVIDRVTSPSSEDTRSRFSFFRAILIVQKIIVDAWNKSNGTQNYLGEWHTHPEDTPSPSHIDIKNWENIFRQTKTEAEELFFVIVGRQETKVWSIKGKGNIPIELHRKLDMD